MQCILVFRFRSTMSDQALLERMESRLQVFREVDGLLQKYYCRDPETGSNCGVCLFETAEHARAFREGPIVAGIPEALEVDGEIRLEQLDFLMALRPDGYVAG